MCRWVAYSGPEIYLEDLIFHQEHSIVSQSLAATQSAWVTNGDGFGVAWYTKRTTPGLFKDVLPAWNDSNLRSLAAHIQTKLFFAHVRATTGTAVNRSNCHPFIWKNWTFMHNGKIGNWHGCRKDVEDLIDHIHYPHREGTTDSEALFLVALSKGLISDPIKAIEETLRDVSRIMDKHHSDEPMRISCALTNGKEIWAHISFPFVKAHEIRMGSSEWCLSIILETSRRVSSIALMGSLINPLLSATKNNASLSVVPSL